MPNGPHTPDPLEQEPINSIWKGSHWHSGWKLQKQPNSTPKNRGPWVHVLLFLLTVISTTLVGGFGYSACLLTILAAHEFGHYFTAKHYQVQVTLPYFIPFPSLFGTLGAVIRMSPSIPNRRALFDIAASGPLSGLVVAVPISLIGIYLSERTIPNPDQSVVMLGDPLLFRAMEWFFFGPRIEGQDLMLHPVGFAGWVGLFVTALNLIPVGQLDGGHISYALFGRHANRIASMAFIALLVLTLVEGYHYTLILILLWFMGLKHPNTANDAYGIGSYRRNIGIFLAIVLVICFSPVPVQF